MSKKILWHSNAPWSLTGYGIQTKTFTHRIQEMEEYDVTISAFWGLEGNRIQLGDITVLPKHSDSYGNDVIKAHCQSLEADLFLTLMDIWVLDPKRTINLPWAAWMPVDHYPIPAPVKRTLDGGKPVPIAMSKFGRDVLKEEGYDPLYVPHAVDPLFFEEVDRKQLRKDYGWDDKFVVTMTAANKGYPSRKSFAEVFQAFKIFADRHPDEALLYLQTDFDTPWGINLKDMANNIGIPHNNLIFTDKYQYIIGQTTDVVRNCMVASDVLMNPARGEGFGVPIIEAQAAGIPVIVTNWTAMPELCYYGHVVEGKKVYTNQDAWQKIPHVDELVEAMEFYYQTPESERIEKGKWASSRIREEYHPDVVMEKYWKPVLEEAIERVKDRKITAED